MGIVATVATCTGDGTLVFGELVGGFRSACILEDIL